MKKLLLILILSGCTAKTPTYSYECGILSMHGVFAKLTGDFHSEVEAQEEAEKVRLQLVSQKAVPENTGVMCYRNK